MTIGQRIKKYRLELGLSVDEVASRLGKNRATIYRYENNNIKELPITVLEPLAKVLNTTPADLMGWEDDSSNTDNDLFTKYSNIHHIEKKALPILGSVACGKPIFMSEERESYVEVGTEVRADYCLRAKGDSMINARINDGDIIFVRQQSTVENGEIAVVAVDDEATLKRVYYYPETQKLVLQAENPAYAPLLFVGNELEKVHILGKAVALQTDIR